MRDLARHSVVPQVNRLDDNEGIYFGTELTRIKQKSYDKLYPMLRARDVLPVSYEADPGDETIKFYQFDIVGFAKIAHTYGIGDFPLADIKGKEFISNIKSLTAGFSYNIQEIRAAAKVNRPLPERKAASARRAIMYLENNIAFFGDDANRLGGFLTNPNVPVGAVAADGLSNGTAWSSKSPDQIIRDVNVAIREIPVNTKGVEYPNTVLLPINQYELIASTPRSSLSDTTILAFLKGVHPNIEFASLPFELTGTGSGVTDQMVVYTRDPDKLTLEVPQEFEQGEPTLEGMRYTIPCHQRSGGVIIYYPLSINIKYGI